MNIYSISVDAPGLSYKAYCLQMAQFEKEFINQIIWAESESWESIKMGLMKFQMKKTTKYKP